MPAKFSKTRKVSKKRAHVNAKAIPQTEWDFLSAILRPDVEGIGRWITGLIFAKHYVLCLTILSFLGYPILQIILSLLICLSMSIISIKIRQFVSLSKNNMLITVDVVGVLSVLFFLLIYLLDENIFGVTISERGKYLYIGNVLLCIILASLVVSMVTGLVEAIRSAVMALKKFFDKKNKDKKEGSKKEKGD